MLLTRRQFIACSGATLAAPSIISARSEELKELELILALDESGSEFERNPVPHWGVQLHGHIHALKQKRIREALLDRQTFLRIVTWSDQNKGVRVVFEGALQSSATFDQVISSLERNLFQSCSMEYCPDTNHSWLMQHVNSMSRMGQRRVLDVSTDEAPREKLQEELDAAKAVFEGQNGTVNALAVRMGDEAKQKLQTNLCSRHGACFSADEDREYPQALEKKMFAEIG